MKYGKVVLNVTDLEGHSVSLDVVVVSSVLSTDNQRFVWGNMIELNKANNWSLFTDVNSVAITNVMEGRQYVLSCDGDLSVGVKSNATLEILSSKIVANKRSVSSNKFLIFSSEGCFPSSMALKSEGDNEKNAISEAEAKPEASKSTPAKTMAIIAEIEGACTVIPLKISANWHK